MRSNEFDSKIIIYKSKRMVLWLSLMLATGFLTLMIAEANETDTHWMHLVIPLTFFGLLLCLIPPSEHWEYKPWQSKPRRVEQHFDKN